MMDNGKHNYQIEIERLVREGVLQVEKSDVRHILVAHDDNCGIYVNKECNCAPDICDAITGQILNKKLDLS